MREDMDEQLPTRPDPAADLAEEELVVLHVLEHLNGNNPVKVLPEPVTFELCNIS